MTSPRQAAGTRDEPPGVSAGTTLPEVDEGWVGIVATTAANPSFRRPSVLGMHIAHAPFMTKTPAMLFAMIMMTACATSDVTDVPAPIDDELLAETFPACAGSIDACLEDEAVAVEIERRVDAGEWAWPQEEDTLAAEQVRLTREMSTCMRDKSRVQRAAKLCRLRGGSLYSVAYLKRCTADTARYSVVCRRR
jgi:hypothetical protein